MRILHLAWEYPPLVYGGLGRHVHALAEAQAAAGHSVTVVTQRVEDSAADELLNGVRVLRVPAESAFPYDLSRLLPWVTELESRLAARADTWLRHDGADVVHVHDWMVGRAGAELTAKHGLPFVGTLHATEAGRHQGWLPDEVSRQVHVIEHWLAEEADVVIVCSRAMAREAAAAHRVAADRLAVVPNGIDLSRYPRPDQFAPDLLTGSHRIGFVGRIEWEKGVFTAVRAWPDVLAAHPGAQLRIVGTGGQAAAVAELVDELGLTASVHLLGHVDHRRLLEVYGSSDAVLAPSSYEPFGLVALEAAAVGAPLIAGAAGGLAEFVDDGRTGWLVTPQDPQALARAVLEVLGDPAEARRRAAAAHDRLVDYDWARIADRTVDVYRGAKPRVRPPRTSTVPPMPLFTPR